MVVQMTLQRIPAAERTQTPACAHFPLELVLVSVRANAIAFGLRDWNSFAPPSSVVVVRAGSLVSANVPKEVGLVPVGLLPATVGAGKVIGNALSDSVDLNITRGRSSALALGGTRR